ncbi:Gp64 [Mycolicibacterium brisbanense]|uniref:Gp64 n=2 Tax=Mycolicibacterium brisbanense TaxID=146020 RepID=A0A100W6U9_9MYCO|nr:Gp64 [Mycolicibacterium brisbanense]
MLTPEQDAQVVDLTLAGRSRAEIAREMRISVNQVDYARRRAHTARFTKFSIERVVELTKQNYSAPQIATILGCTTRHVVRLRAKAGIAKPAPLPLNAEQVVIAERLLDDGASLTEVARTIGRSPRTVQARFRGRGFTHSQIGQYSQLMRAMRRRGLRELIA